MTHPLAADAAQALQGVAELIEALGDYRRNGSALDTLKLRKEAAALTALSAENAALKAQVAELTRERDEARRVAHEAIDMGQKAGIERMQAEAKVARLEGALRKIGMLAPVEKPPEPYDANGWQTADTGERHAERVLAKDMWLVADFARAALKGDTNG